jgi:hypothetical protein
VKKSGMKNSNNKKVVFFFLLFIFFGAKSQSVIESEKLQLSVKFIDTFIVKEVSFVLNIEFINASDTNIFLDETFDEYGYHNASPNVVLIIEKLKENTFVEYINKTIVDFYREREKEENPKKIALGKKMKAQVFYNINYLRKYEPGEYRIRLAYYKNRNDYNYPLYSNWCTFSVAKEIQAISYHAIKDPIPRLNLVQIIHN